MFVDLDKPVGSLFIRLLRDDNDTSELVNVLKYLLFMFL